MRTAHKRRRWTARAITGGSRACESCGGAAEGKGREILRPCCHTRCGLVCFGAHGAPLTHFRSARATAGRVRGTVMTLCPSLAQRRS
eukprot:7391246-Prymnesium_polylepis.1